MFDYMNMDYEKNLREGFVVCNGCPENLIESRRIQTYLETNGWHCDGNPATADLIIFNACALSEERENLSKKIITTIQKRRRTDSQLIVCGCLSKIDPETLREVYEGPLIGEQELYQLDKIINATSPIEQIHSNQILDRYSFRETGVLKNIAGLVMRSLGWLYINSGSKINLRRNDPHIFYIQTSTGCLGNCTYCAIRNARGKIKSKPINKIMLEFKDGLRRGFQEFSLLGTDLGPQGRDLGYNLVDLLQEMVKEKGEYRIGLRNVHPYFLKLMLNDLEPILYTGKIWYMGIAAESGSNRILNLMKRNYAREDYQECIQRVKKANPSLKVRTQMMVGFPTETEHDFIESIRLLDQVDLDFIEVYKYSPRPNTVAKAMKGQISNRIAQFRLYRMLAKAQSLLLLNTLKHKLKS